MQTKQNLISNLSFKALEAKARKAAAIASVTVAKPATLKKKKTLPAITLEINSIYQTLVRQTPDDKVVILESPVKESSCRARISIYYKDDILRQQEEEEARKAAKRLGKAVSEKRPFRAMPTVMYALYPAITDRSKLGSVAIYGAAPNITLNCILKSGSLFGHLVKSASIEIGYRPFVDVNFRN